MTRKTWWLAVPAVLIALPAATVLIAATTIDPNDYKSRLIDAVQSATGRTLSLDGPLRVTWSLWPTLEVNGARLSNIPGGTRPDMARAERIEAQISLPALLARRIDVLQLRLVGPNILFEVAGGKSNWVLTPPPTPADPAPPDPAPPAAPPPAAAPLQLHIRAVHVQNGMVTWHLPATTRVVGLRSLDWHHKQDGAIDLAGTLVYADNQPFTLQAQSTATGGLHDPWRTDIAFAAYDTTARAKGTMNLAGDYDLDIDAQSGALDKLNALLPEMALPPLHGIDLSAHVTNNPVLGSLPALGPAHITFDSADLTRLVPGVTPGVTLGKTELSLPAAGGNASVTTEARLAGQAVTLAGTVGVPRQPGDRTTVPLDLTAKAAGATLSLAGKLQLARLRFAGLDATAALHAPALAALRPLRMPGLPPLEQVEFAGQLAVPADARSFRFAKARLSTQDGDFAGDGSVDLGNGLTALQAKLRSTRLDLDAVLPALGIDLSAAPTGPLAERSLPWTLVGGPKLDITATIAAATFRQQTWRDAALSFQHDRGKQSARLRVAMPDGPAELSMTADNAAQTVPASLSVKAPGIPLALLAHYAGLPGVVTGSARVEADLRGSGRTVHDFAATLNGPFSLSATDGQLSNAAFIKLTAGSLEPLGIVVPAQGETALRCLGLAGAANNGVVGLQTIALETTHLSLSGTGQVDLGRETVALKLHPLAQIAGSPVAVPVVVEGPFQAITGRLDATGLDQAGLLIDGLFGGDTPDACRNAGLLPAPPKGSRGKD